MKVISLSQHIYRELETSFEPHLLSSEEYVNEGCKAHSISGSWQPFSPESL